METKPEDPHEFMINFLIDIIDTYKQVRRREGIV